jgi:hypothetical protein
VQEPCFIGLYPWEDPSWINMLSFQAWNFFWCGMALRGIQADCMLSSLAVDPSTPIFSVDRTIDETARSKAAGALKHVVTMFDRIGLRITAETTKELIEELEAASFKRNIQWLLDQIKGIQKLSEKEIQGKAFFYVSAEKMKFYPTSKEPHVFGEQVGKSFPSAAQDIFESGVCLALDRGSACVFHLMRVLEIGLTVLGDKFGVSLEHTNWGPAIEEIEKKVREMHKDPVWKALADCKDQQEFYAQAASHFGVLKDAWRNYTMHVRGFYTEEQAEMIFQSVKAFMQKLSTRLSE